MAITFERAREIAADEIRHHEEMSGIPLAIADEYIVTHEDGWIFYWDTEAFVKHGDSSHPIAGNTPIVVLKDGTVRSAPAACSDAPSVFAWLSKHPLRHS